ncbi:MAG: hypothetical protein LKG25_02035 [Prevotella sp.]|jgi:tetratricopeptide (TPR) repeat protein|nr:hypothetical protein [Prevotella sp.]MCI1281359.1 hypothetical protein [Prevotella sp.]
MKKLMIMALMILGSSVAFAGQSDALKAVLKAKTFDEALALVKSNLNSFVDNSEKAAAYNKLTDLAMEKVTKEQTTMTSNQLAKQMKSKLEPVDTMGYYKATYDALTSGLECEKYDIMPNEKGKVKPKFHEANRDRLWPIRVQLINYGQQIGETDKDAALNAFGTYVQSHDNSLFTEVAGKSKDEYLGEVSRVAAVYAYQSKKMDLANQYVDIALKDSATFKQALDMKIFFASQGLKTKEDSVKFEKTLEDLYVKNPGSDAIFGQLTSMYQTLGQKDKSAKLIADRLAADPKNYTALAMKAQNDMNSNKFDDAIDGFKKAIEVKSDEPLIYAYMGFCLNSKAAASQNPAEVKKLYLESVGYLEKARQIDPNRERANWAYPLYQCYYSLYGDNDSRTKEIHDLIK